MKHNGILDIATGHNIKSKKWKNNRMQWSELVERLSQPYHTNETLAEFMKASKGEQQAIKDVGGFVSGFLNGGRREIGNVVHKQMLTLDIDFANDDFWDDFTMIYDCAAFLHGTHKHRKGNPRLRLLVPLDREVSPTEYLAISRRLAGTLGIELFDNTTFDVNRLMFWQSTPKDQPYYFEVQDGAWLSADDLLATYVDYTDSSQWPTSAAFNDEIRGLATKQQNPKDKSGLIGAFCRTYSITDVIATHLDSVYDLEPNGRYTYKLGTAAGGLIVYDDIFAYSHHGTDPTSHILCNAFDLVRIHKFGHLDLDSDATGSAKKSFKAMEQFVLEDKQTKATVARENFESVQYDFAISEEDLASEDITAQTIDDEDMSWMDKLEADKFGRFLSTDMNIDIIFKNDPRLKGIFAYSTFDKFTYLLKSVPWRRIVSAERLRNVDKAGLRNYFGIAYGISGSQKIDDAFQLEQERNAFHPVRNYLNSLSWDGIKRIDNLLVKYFGAEDSVYTRESMRITLVGAVKRVMQPGCKFDTMLVLTGDQGSGKSTFISKLGKEWFSDSLTSVAGERAMEQIQGVWLIEMAELAASKKAEVESVKHFITKQADDFRGAYKEVKENTKRQCVFFGTTNEMNFLKDATGDRRFLPIQVNIEDAVAHPVPDLHEKEVDQIWAEAMHLYQNGSPTVLGKDAAVIAKQMQADHAEIDERMGDVERFMEILVPDEFFEADSVNRIMMLNREEPLTEGYRRDRVSVAEIWVECFGEKLSDIRRIDSFDINNILKRMGWHSTGKRVRTIYGQQRCYSRTKSAKTRVWKKKGE